MGFSTDCIHAGNEPDPTTGAVTVPIYQTSTYVQEALGKHKGYEYARTQNPTRHALEENLAVLEGGAGARAFASGMAAITAISTFVKAGEHVVCSNMTYGGTFRYYTKIQARYGVEFTFVDTSDDERGAARPSARTRSCCTSSRRRIRRCALRHRAALGARARARRARRRRQHVLLAVPAEAARARRRHRRPLDDEVPERPLRLGRRHRRREEARSTSSGSRSSRTAPGAILSPFDSWLVLRGIKTLAVRMERHEANGRAVAAWLAKQPKVRKVNYPGLPDHPQHALAKKQMTGFGAMISFDLGSFEKAGSVPREAAPLLARREPRRRRDAHLASGDDDARLDPRGRAQPPRRHARSRAHLRRHRGRRGPDRRSRAGPRRGQVYVIHFGMARPLRLEFPGAVYHVLSRGHERSNIYRDNVDREKFLALLATISRDEQWVIHAYCFMSNHYHLLIETPVGGLSHGMRSLNGRYTQWFNLRRERTGHLFEGRFRSIVVQKDSHLLELMRYVVLNPVRARIVERPGDWRWSSYRATLGREEAPSWLDVDWTLAQFAARRPAAREAFRRFVLDAAGAARGAELERRPYLGDGAFLKKMQRLIEERGSADEIPVRFRRATGSNLDTIRGAVAREWRVPKESLARRRGGAEKKAAIFLARKLTRLTGTGDRRRVRRAGRAGEQCRHRDRERARRNAHGAGGASPGPAGRAKCIT